MAYKFNKLTETLFKYIDEDEAALLTMKDMDEEITEPRDIINSQIFDFKEPKKKSKKTFRREVLRDGILVLVFLFLGANIFPILTGAATLVNAALLYFNGTKMDLPEPTPIEFNVNSFLEIASPYECSETEILSYISVYSSDESLEEHLALELPQYEGEKYSVYDGLQYNHIHVKLDVVEKYGELTMRASLNESSTELYSYEIKAIFAIDGYTPDSTKIKFEQEKATSEFAYAGGKKAYLIKNWGFGTQTVYFEKDGLLFTFEIPDTEENIANAQKLLEIMAEGGAS